MSLKKLGRYELIRVLGKGAMGIVYEGRDPNLDRRVAIKTVKVENLSEEAAAEYEHRFRTEARSAARLQHPNIVSVYDSDRDGDIAFLVMEYIQGDDLKHYIDFAARGPVALGEAITAVGGMHDYESDFEMAVAEGIRRLGWAVRTQVGVSKFRIDLAVVHPDVPMERHRHSPPLASVSIWSSRRRWGRKRSTA